MTMSGHRRLVTERGDDYTDVADMFGVLGQMPAYSPQRCRQREQIVARSLPLADDVARYFGRCGETIDDLIQVARLGLLMAVDRFDPSQGSTFASFAVPTMMAEVRRYLRDQTWAAIEGPTPLTIAEAAGVLDDGLQRVIDREVIRLLVAGLPNRERQVLHMRFFESMTMGEIARQCGLTDKPVSRILSRALSLLRERLLEEQA
jgi:RNA polymerase sigma-B factor